MENPFEIRMRRVGRPQSWPELWDYVKKRYGPVSVFQWAVLALLGWMLLAVAASFVCGIWHITWGESAARVTTERNAYMSLHTQCLGNPEWAMLGDDMVARCVNARLKVESGTSDDHLKAYIDHIEDSIMVPGYQTARAYGPFWATACLLLFVCIMCLAYPRLECGGREEERNQFENELYKRERERVLPRITAGEHEQLCEPLRRRNYYNTPHGHDFSSLGSVATLSVVDEHHEE